MGTSQFISSLSRGLAIALLLAWAPRAWAVDPAEWLIVQGINRGETSATWTSPTAVDLDEVAWQWDFEITRITGTVNLGVFGNVTEDMTSSFPEEFRVRSGVVGALPAVLIDDVLVEPASGTSMDLMIEIDAAGVGRAQFSEIMLGSVNVPLFGSRPIERIDIEGSLNVAGVVPEPGFAGLLAMAGLALCRGGGRSDGRGGARV